MPRKMNCRRISGLPTARCFKPQGVPMCETEQIVLKLDELEAIKLSDAQGLYQSQAAEEMNVSRQTFGRIIESAHRKVAQALVEGKSLIIEGGEFTVSESRRFECRDCGHAWELTHGTGRPANCPSCSSIDIHRTDDNERSCCGKQRRRCAGKHSEGEVK